MLKNRFVSFLMMAPVLFTVSSNALASDKHKKTSVVATEPSFAKQAAVEPVDKYRMVLDNGHPQPPLEELAQCFTGGVDFLGASLNEEDSLRSYMLRGGLPGRSTVEPNGREWYCSLYAGGCPLAGSRNVEVWVANTAVDIDDHGGGWNPATHRELIQFACQHPEAVTGTIFALADTTLEGHALVYTWEGKLVLSASGWPQPQACKDCRLLLVRNLPPH